MQQPIWQDWVLYLIKENLEIKGHMATQQSDINALKAKVDDLDAKVVAASSDIATISTGVASLKATIADLKQQIADLQAANPTLDLSGVQASVDKAESDMGDVVAAADSVVATLTPAS